MRSLMLALLLVVLNITNLMADTLSELPTAKSLQATFIQTHHLPVLETPLITHGNLRVDANTLIWQVTSPYSYTYAMHDGIVRETGPDGVTRTITTEQAPWVVPVKKLFTALLGADQQALERLFMIESKKTPAGILLNMTPRNKFLRQAITRIQVWHSPWPNRILIYEASGGKLDIEIHVTEVISTGDKIQ